MPSSRSRRLSRLTAIRIAACAVCSIVALRAGAEELGPAFVAEHGGLLVSSVDYSGNERTRGSAIAELTGIVAGMRVSDIDPDAVKQSLLKSGIFSEAGLDVEIADGTAAVTVQVREKWTFIPIPSGYYGSGGWSAGLDLLEYNFLGLRKTLVIGGSDSNLGVSGTIAYIDPRFLRSRTSFKAFASYGNANVEAEYQDDSDYASYNETTANAGLYAEYPSEDKLRADAELTLRYTGLSTADAGRYAGLYGESLLLIPGVGVTYDGQRFSGYHESGPTANLSYTHGFSLRDMPSYDSIEASAELMLGTFLDGLADLGFAGKYGDRPFQTLGSLSGPGYRTLPQGYSYSAKNVALYSSLELPFVEAPWCVMTAGAFYEGGIYATGLAGDRTELFHGPGLSYRLYLHDIALPAVGIDAAYNVPIGIIVFSLNVGVSL
jgi:outer membrane protein assembly factor BamA